MKIIVLALLASVGFYSHAQAHTKSIRSSIYFQVRDTVPLPLADSAFRNDTRVFTKAQTEATYQGGDVAWNRLVDSTLSANQDILRKDRNQSEGTCHLFFVISNTGRVSDVQAMDKQSSVLAKVLVQMVKDNPNWNPGLVNGHVVNSFHKVKVEFTLP